MTAAVSAAPRESINVGRSSVEAQPAATIPVIDCAAGQECQLDTGWVLRLAPDARGRKRRVKAWIFTAVRSRHRFVYPIERETTESGIEAWEAAWRYFTGVFAVLIVDNVVAVLLANLTHAVYAHRHTGAL